MQSLFEILMLLLSIAQFIIIVQVILSWLVGFNQLGRLPPQLAQMLAQLWTGLERLTDPVYRPIRRFLPSTQGIDLAPLIALVAIYALRIILNNSASSFTGGEGETNVFWHIILSSNASSFIQY